MLTSGTHTNSAPSRLWIGRVGYLHVRGNLNFSVQQLRRRRNFATQIHIACSRFLGTKVLNFWLGHCPPSPLTCCEFVSLGCLYLGRLDRFECWDEGGGGIAGRRHDLSCTCGELHWRCPVLLSAGESTGLLQGHGSLNELPFLDSVLRTSVRDEDTSKVLEQHLVRLSRL